VVKEIMATTPIKDIIKQLNNLHDGDVWPEENFAFKAKKQVI